MVNILFCVGDFDKISSRDLVRFLDYDIINRLKIYVKKEDFS